MYKVVKPALHFLRTRPVISIVLAFSLATISLFGCNQTTFTQTITFVTDNVSFSMDFTQKWESNKTNKKEVLEVNGNSRIIVLSFNPQEGKDLTDFIKDNKDEIADWQQECGSKVELISEKQTRINDVPAELFEYIAPYQLGGEEMMNLTAIFFNKSYFRINCLIEKDLYTSYHTELVSTLRSFRFITPE
jgi:hypothetical protein